MTQRSAVCPFEVDRPVMFNHWDTLTLLHWRYEPEVVQQLLPEGIEVEPFDGSAWVGLVPFGMRVAFPRLPFRFAFPETNVRTYVTGPNGRTGVWFFSLDAGHLASVLAGRVAYGVPYYWSEMSIQRTGDRIDYVARRRWPKPSGGRSLVSIEVGERIATGQLTDLDLYLSSRFELFGTRRGAITYARAQHPPWELHRAAVLAWEDELVAACGLPTAVEAPLAHWSDTTSVRIGRPTIVASALTP